MNTELRCQPRILFIISLLFAFSMGPGVVFSKDTKGPQSDVTPPQIEEVFVTFKDSNRISLQLITDEPAMGYTVFGTNCSDAIMIESLMEEEAGTYSVEVDDLDQGTAYYFKFYLADEAGNAVIDDNGGWCYRFATPLRVVQQFFDFEDDLEGFSTEALLFPADWQRIENLLAHGAHAMHVANTASIQDSRLISPPVSIGPEPTYLEFWHTFEFGVDVVPWHVVPYIRYAPTDGGVVEMSLDQGEWQNLKDRILIGRYRGYLSSMDAPENPLVGQSAYTEGRFNTMDFVRIDLSGLQGSTARFRWRIGTNDVTEAIGWMVDDIVVVTVEEISLTPNNLDVLDWFLLQVGDLSPDVNADGVVDAADLIVN